MRRSSYSTPTGPGSRGGHWHEPEFRRRYYRMWRLAHPEYRERESLRRERKRGNENGTRLTSGNAPIVVTHCTCLVDGCKCDAEVIAICGFCREGLHVT